MAWLSRIRAPSKPGNRCLPDVSSRPPRPPAMAEKGSHQASQRVGNTRRRERGRTHAPLAAISRTARASPAAARQDPQSQPSIGQEEPISNPGRRPFLSAHGPSPHQLAPLSARTPPQSGVPRTSHARPSDDVGHQDARMRVCRRAPGRRAPTRIAGPQPRSKNKMYIVPEYQSTRV
ncbi:hypothetical protein PtB15_5B686 [Puccinia triticina]|nr:hypothetical protein PtB15_5B686 [Puccinia triticina]